MSNQFNLQKIFADDLPHRLQVNAQAGLGKTSAVIDELCRAQAYLSKYINVYVPTFDLAEELALRFQRHGYVVLFMKGRSALYAETHM